MSDGISDSLKGSAHESSAREAFWDRAHHSSRRDTQTDVKVVAPEMDVQPERRTLRGGKLADALVYGFMKLTGKRIDPNSIQILDDSVPMELKARENYGISADVVDGRSGRKGKLVGTATTKRKPRMAATSTATTPDPSTKV